MNRLDIFSDKGTYPLFMNRPLEDIQSIIATSKVVVIDAKVLKLYQEVLQIDDSKVILVEAFEDNKRPETAMNLCEQLMLRGIKRDDTVVAIGGGITQDLMTFAASILFRGIQWIWFPTTLLAQADSCIGGKSSLNFKQWKNIIGNFYPPKEIYIQEAFLTTLVEDDIRSGIGEILKVHLLSGADEALKIMGQMKNFIDKEEGLSEMIFNSLLLKNAILKIDPLDTGLRLKMNYGHSFGHALEAATHFHIPHGIGVTIGLDIANYVAWKNGFIDESLFLQMHETLYHNLKETDFISFDFELFITALKADKKNSETLYHFIVPIAFGEVEKRAFPMNEACDTLIQSYFKNYYTKKIQ